MLRYAALLLATLFACGCQNPAQSMNSPGPFGGQRIPPPGTNAYPQPDISYPGGSNPAGANANLAPVGAAGGTNSNFGPGRLFNSQPGPGASPATGTNWRPGSTGTNGNSLFAESGSALWGNTASGVTPARFGGASGSAPANGVRFGDNRAPLAQSSIRQNGMPVNDATRGSQPRASSSAVGSGIPEITDYPRAAGVFPPAPPGRFANSYTAPYGPSPTPYYAPGYGPTAPGPSGGSNSLGWKTKAGDGGTLR